MELKIKKIGGSHAMFIPHYFLDNIVEELPPDEEIIGFNVVFLNPITSKRGD